MSYGSVAARIGCHHASDWTMSEDPPWKGSGKTLMTLKTSSALSGLKRMSNSTTMIYGDPATEHDERYEFGPFQLISVERQLLRNGSPVPITDKAFETLLAL